MRPKQSIHGHGQKMQSFLKYLEILATNFFNIMEGDKFVVFNAAKNYASMHCSARGLCAECGTLQHPEVK